MVINIIVCIAAVVLILRGIFLLLKMKLMWMLYSIILKAYTKRTYGKVVDIESKTEPDGSNVYVPKVECIFEGQEGKSVQLIPSIIKVEGEDAGGLHFYPKEYRIGDKVMVLYGAEKSESMFLLPRMLFVRMFFTHFVTGCIFIVAAILGICFVF